MVSEAHPAPRFFVLENDPDSSHDTTFTSVESKSGEAPSCAQCGTFVGLREWLPPLRGTMRLYGQEFGDLVSGPGAGFLVSARFVESFQEERLTGIPRFQPVEIVRRVQRPRRAAPPAYFYMRPLFGGAAVNESASRIRRLRPIQCDGCRSGGVNAIHGISLEEGSWTGSDIFFARGLPGTAIVSERFARAVHHHGLTNIRLTPTETYVRDPLELGPVPRPEA